MNTINTVNTDCSDKSKYFLTTVDVEDWFQVENFKPWIPFDTWGQRELRVEKNVHRLLDLFDAVSARSIASRPAIIAAPGSSPILPHKATFFVLAWVAQRIPSLLREMISRGHEVASHGCRHELPKNFTDIEFRNDLIDSKKLIEDITGTRVYGYRAPSFSIDDQKLKIIATCGYSYDSSYNSFSLHGRYGRLNLNGYQKKSIAYKLPQNFYELPVSNLETNLLSPFYKKKRNRSSNSGVRFILPFGGGSYFRLIPYSIIRYGLKRYFNDNRTYLFYLHPWEVDPSQPVVKNASLTNKFKHYYNLRNTRDKLHRLFSDFNDVKYISCKKYINIIETEYS